MKFYKYADSYEISLKTNFIPAFFIYEEFLGVTLDKSYANMSQQLLLSHFYSLKFIKNEKIAIWARKDLPRSIKLFFTDDGFKNRHTC